MGSHRAKDFGDAGAPPFSRRRCLPNVIDPEKVSQPDESPCETATNQPKVRKYFALSLDKHEQA